MASTHGRRPPVMADVAKEAGGYFVSLKSIDRPGMRDPLDCLADQGVDGIIVVATQRTATQAPASRGGVARR
ncbi:hypothetical protein AB0B45_14080 [Nonomuraea sp. NPDC049152]|uniref:hypothetical protein n=1 Tax=Nonomuraea sp. NPDC049152 TaxID=3154350 RepID=UPI0033DE0A42